MCSVWLEGKRTEAQGWQDAAHAQALVRECHERFEMRNKPS